MSIKSCNFILKEDWSPYIFYASTLYEHFKFFGFMIYCKIHKSKSYIQHNNSWWA